MSHSVASHLAVDVADYDASIRRFVPGYDEMLAELSGALLRFFRTREHFVVVDLGAGTGRLAERVLRDVPQAEVVLLDADADILRVAERRLADKSDRVRFLRGSFFDALPECDAVVASLSLHHIFEPARKRAVYESIARALRPGGALFIADAMLTEQGRLADEARRLWAAHLMAHGDTEAEAFGRFAEWAREDRYLPVAEELSALAGAGFAEVDVLWRRGPTCILTALRAD